MAWQGEVFARRLAVLMAERGIESKQLAQDADLSYPQVRRLLRGRTTRPSTAELRAVAGAVGVPLEVLLGEQEATLPGSAEERDVARLAAVEERLARVEAIAVRLEQRLLAAGLAPPP